MNYSSYKICKMVPPIQIHPSARWLSEIPFSRKHVSADSESSGSELFLQAVLAVAYDDVRLVSGCSTMTIHFMKLQTHRSCAMLLSVAV